MNTWWRRLTEVGETAVLVTVAQTRGSTPREPGASMLVFAAQIHGTIGGGNLEHQAIEFARQSLADKDRRSHKTHMVLGPDLGQCCGGTVDLVFQTVAPDQEWLSLVSAAAAVGETVCLATVTGQVGSAAVTQDRVAGSITNVCNADLLSAARHILCNDSFRTQLCVTESNHEVMLLPIERSGFDLQLFGAGHVGRALIGLLADLPCRVRWIDSRRDQFPPSIPANVTAVISFDPAAEVALAAPRSQWLVLTHDHALDLELCERILRRGDAAFCGLIGSRSKRARFLRRLEERGLDQTTLSRLTCPIGIAGIESKAPGQIALAVAAQLLQEYHRQTGSARGPQLVHTAS